MAETMKSATSHSNSGCIINCANFSHPQGFRTYFCSHRRIESFHRSLPWFQQPWVTSSSFFFLFAGVTLGEQLSRRNMWSSAAHPQACAAFPVMGRASARSPPSANGDPCSPGGCAVQSVLLLHRGTWGMAPGGIYYYYVLFQLDVPSSQVEDDNLFWP